MPSIASISGEIRIGEYKDLYKVPFAVTYVFEAQDFGAGDWTQLIETPPGYYGFLKTIDLYNVTEIFSTTTTEAKVNVGTAGDADAYGSSPDLGALAVDAADSPTITYGVTQIIPANSSVQVQGIAPTGGTPTGIATTAVTIIYFK